MRGADVLGARSEERARLQIASLVHDIGRVAVSKALWDKPGPPGRSEAADRKDHECVSHGDGRPEDDRLPWGRPTPGEKRPWQG